MSDFRDSKKIQIDVMKWHVSDIDKNIAKLGDKAKGFDKDGLRAVAHLGGITGMKKFISTNMKYNPEDSNQTSLKDYYNKFSFSSKDETVRGEV